MSDITNCYATGAVSGHTSVGGFAGLNRDVINRVYSIGAVFGTDFVGGLIGWNDGTVTSSFWDIQTSGIAHSMGGVGKTTVEMKTLATFAGAGWDIGYASADLASGYPFLSWQLGNSHTWLMHVGIGIPAGKAYALSREEL